MIYSYSNGSIRKLNNILTKSLIIGASLNKEKIDTNVVFKELPQINIKEKGEMAKLLPYSDSLPRELKID